MLQHTYSQQSLSALAKNLYMDNLNQRGCTMRSSSRRAKRDWRSRTRFPSHILAPSARQQCPGRDYMAPEERQHLRKVFIKPQIDNEERLSETGSAGSVNSGAIAAAAAAATAAATANIPDEAVENSSMPDQQQTKSSQEEGEALAKAYSDVSSSSISQTSTTKFDSRNTSSGHDRHPSVREHLWSRSQASASTMAKAAAAAAMRPTAPSAPPTSRCADIPTQGTVEPPSRLLIGLHTAHKRAMRFEGRLYQERRRRQRIRDDYWQQRRQNPSLPAWPAYNWHRSKKDMPLSLDGSRDGGSDLYGMDEEECEEDRMSDRQLFHEMLRHEMFDQINSHDEMEMTRKASGKPNCNLIMAITFVFLFLAGPVWLRHEVTKLHCREGAYNVDVARTLCVDYITGPGTQITEFLGGSTSISTRTELSDILRRVLDTPPTPTDNAISSSTSETSTLGLYVSTSTVTEESESNSLHTQTSESPWGFLSPYPLPPSPSTSMDFQTPAQA